MSDHFSTPAEQAAFFAAWHAQQQAAASSDILQPVLVYPLGEMACTTGADDARPTSFLAWARECAAWLSAACCDLSRN